MPCPNKNTTQWNNLVAALDGNEVDALVVFNLNDFDIPTDLQLAKELLNKFKNNEQFTDEDYKAGLKEKKLKRVNEQLDTIEIAINTAKSDAQKTTLNTLKDNLLKYRSIIENDDPTVSVTNLIAGGEIENNELYKNYAEFGTFIHFVIEELQKETLGSNTSLLDVFTKEKLQKLFKEYDKKFEIKNLVENGVIINVDDLFRMANNLLGNVQHYISMGHMVLPEISVVTEDRFGRNVVARLDILSIDKNGVINIIDTKTKKVNMNAMNDSLLAYWPVNGSKYTDSNFMQTGNRNTYDNWDLQLGTYSRMLNALGLATDQKIILKLLYAGEYMNVDQPSKQFDVLGNDTYEYRYFKNEIYISDENKGNQTDYLRYRKFMKLINNVIPIANEEENPQDRVEDRNKNIFNLSNEQADVLLEKIKKTVEGQRSETAKKLAEAKRTDADQKLIKYYEERLRTLNNITEYFERDWESAYKVSTILTSLQIDMQNLSQTVQNIKSSTSDSELIDRAKDLEILNKISSSYNEFITGLNNYLLDGGLQENDKALAVIADIQKNIGIIRSIYHRLGFRFTMQVLRDALVPEQVEKMSEQRKQAIGAQINSLKKKRDALAAGKKDVGLWYRVINAKFFTPNLTPQTEVEKLDLEIEKLELKMQGIELDDKGLEQYISAILDPKSVVYIGEGTSFWTPFIASSSSSDLLLSSFANRLKDALFTANKEFVNFVEKEKIQQEFNEFKGGETDVTALNDKISEVRNNIEFDENGNETMVQTRAFANPLDERYYNIFERHYNNLRQINKKISETTSAEEKKSLKEEKAAMIAEHLAWRLDNTQMKFVREIYELDELLPADYKEKRDELYYEKNLLEQSAGFNNMDHLDDETLYRIAEIEVELNKLRMEYANKAEGGYQKYLDLMDKYYTYEVNQAYFNRLYDQKKAEYTDTNGNLNLEALERWKAQNMIKRPTQVWYDLVSDIWEDIFAIIGKTNPQIQELKDRYNEILSQYKRKGVIDSRFMTEEDIKTLEEIEYTIELFKSIKGSSGLDFEDRQMLNELFRQLNVIQTKVENPFYLKEFNIRLEALDQKWNKYQQLTDETEKNEALEQFALEEIEFKKWYDDNHTNSYTSRLLSSEGLNPLPKKYNMITVPTDEAMFEMVPDFKFSIRRLKDEALNPDYQEDALGYPMPIGLTRDGAIVSGNSQWLNPKYVQIRNNANDFRFYSSFVGRFLNMQEETTGKMLGYNFPGYQQQSLDDYKNNGVLGGFKNRMKMFRDKNLVIGSTYDHSVNNYRTNVDDRIQLKHNSPLPLDQQTRDGIGAVLRWFENAHVNKAMAEIQPMAKSMINFMESQYEALALSNFPEKQKRMEQLRKVIDQMMFEYDKFVKGEWKKDEGYTGRVVDLVLQGIGFTRLAFDLPAQIGNMFSGNVQAFLGSHKSGQYSAKNYMWAKSKVYGYGNGLIASLMKDQGKFGQRTFMTNMFLYFNPQQKSLEEYYNRTRTTGQRIAQGALDLNGSFWIQDKGEVEIASTIWLSMMDATKVKVVAERNEDGSVKEYLKNEDGSFVTVNAFEAYEQGPAGEVVIRKDVDWDVAREKALQKTVWSEVMRTQGNYAESDKTKNEAGFKGRLLVYYRKYLEPAIRNRVGRLEDRWSSGEMAMGYWNGLIKSIKYHGTWNTTKAILGFKEKSTGVNEFYQRKAQTAAREFATVALMYILGLAIKAAIPPDKEDDRTLGEKMPDILLLNLIAIYAKVHMETSSLVPVPIIGGVKNYIQSVGEFTNAFKDVARIASLLEHGIFLTLAQFSDSKTIQKGAYYQKRYAGFEKGDAKIQKDIMNLTGWMNIYELTNPQIKLRGYKSQQ